MTPACVKRTGAAASVERKRRAQAFLFVFLDPLACVMQPILLFSIFYWLQAINRLTVMLASLSQWVDDIAPVEQPMRYGNKAFRGWHTALVEVPPGA